MEVGEKYGRLTAVRFDHIGSSHSHIWLFKCDCGKEKLARKSNVTAGVSKSCGCLKSDTSKRRLTKHGHTHFKKRDGELKWSPTYMSWTSMKQRCLNKKFSAYNNYGGRGITICKRWLKFENFLEDMGERPSKKYSLDRIDNNKGYSKKNCRWATRKEQARNTRKNHYLEYEGKRMCISELREINPTAASRISNGWNEEDVYVKGRHNRPIKANEMSNPERNYREEKKKIMELFKRSAKIVGTYLSVLEVREREIIEMRFGLKTGKRMTLEAIGKELGLTRERIRQIEGNSVKKMITFYSELSY